MIISQSDEVMRVDFRGANWTWVPFRIAPGAGRLLRHTLRENKLCMVYTFEYTWGWSPERPVTLVNRSPTTVLLP